MQQNTKGSPRGQAAGCISSGDAEHKAGEWDMPEAVINRACPPWVVLLPLPRAGSPTSVASPTLITPSACLVVFLDHRGRFLGN